jgi:HK97 family phage portal protein
MGELERLPSGLLVASRSLGPPDPATLPPRGNVTPNGNDSIGTVGPDAEPGFGAQNVLYPANDPPIQASAWSGWPAMWDTPSTNYGPWQFDLDIVFAAIDLNSRIFADMPIALMHGNERLTPRPWVYNPAPGYYSHAGELWRQVWTAFQAVGEVFMLATNRYADGSVQNFIMLHPAFVQVDWIDGRRAFSINGHDATRDICHIRYASWPGDARGHGPLEHAGERIIAARTLMRYGADLARNGGVPWAVLKHKYRLGGVQAQKLKMQWIESARNRMGAPAILDEDMDLQVLQVPPKDMALSEQQKYAEARIAMLLGVPAYLVSLPSGADPMTYSNVNAIFDYHWRATLKPHGNYIMQALSEWLLPQGSNIVLDAESYIRPDPESRARYYQIMVTIGAMDAAEVRAAERLAPQVLATNVVAGIGVGGDG